MRQLIIVVIGLAIVGQAVSQSKIDSYLILQGAVAKYSADRNGIFGGSLSGGLFIKEHWGLGLNVQAFKWYPGKYYLPVNVEASYSNKKRISPYFCLQIGKGVYQQTTRYIFESGPGYERNKGGYYFSPAAGLLLPFLGKSKLILTAAYVRSEMKRKLVVVGDPIDSKHTSILNGYKIGLGLKL